ncbi:MAG: hypothetical protein AAF928_06950 [Myxococcota bacterium]
MRSLVALTLCTTLLGLATGCHRAASSAVARPEPPRPAAVVTDANFAPEVARLLGDGTPSPARSARLAGVVKAQLAHAATLFDEGYEVRGTNAVIGAMYLLRRGERRPDMVDASSVAALRGAIRRFSARGDEGRAFALMTLLRPLTPPGSEARRDLDRHLEALARWIAQTRTGGDMARLVADARAAIGEAIVDPTAARVADATAAIDRTIARAVAYNIAYQQSRVLPPRGEVSEAYRVLQVGAETMAAVYLRLGRADEAFAALERTAASRIADPTFYAQLGATAERGGADDWRALTRHLVGLARRPGEEHVARDLLEAAIWGASIEAYRRDRGSLTIAHALALQLIEFEMGEAAPLILVEALGPAAPAVALDHALELVGEALSRQRDRPSLAAARRIFAASAPVLERAEQAPRAKRVRAAAAQLRRLMAHIELGHGHVNRARPLLARALTLDPSARAFVQLGQLERQMGNDARALELARAASARPATGAASLDRADAWLLMYEIARDQNQLPRASGALTRALDLVRPALGQPEQAIRAQRTLARILDQFGQTRRARGAFERAIELAGGDRAALTQTVLGAVGRALVAGDLDGGRAALQTALESEVDRDALVYAALWVMLLEKSMSQSPDGKVDRVLVDHTRGSGWTYDLARWARGEAGDDELMAAATTFPEKTEARFYVAMQARVAGRDAGNDMLGAVARTPLLDLWEVQLARRLSHRHPPLPDPGLPRVP